MSERRIVRYDRHGRPEYAPSTTSPTTCAPLADRAAQQERAALKVRQDAGDLTPQERLLSAIFGEIT